MIKKIIYIISFCVFSQLALAAGGDSSSSSSGNDGPDNYLNQYKEAKQLVNRAKKLEKKGKNDKAIKLYNSAHKKLLEAYKKERRNPDILNYLGFSLRKTGNFEQAEKYALQLFSEGEKWASKQGLILVDTKYEFGIVDGKLIVIDEIHTPDSSRYWIKDEYEARFQSGQKQLMLDKENIRQWLIEKGFTGEGTPPELDDEIRTLLSEKYIELYNILTNQEFAPEVGDVSTRIAKNLGSLSI